MSILKPRDLAKVEFRTAWRGYNPQDVDEFVQKMVDAYETLYQEYQKVLEEKERLKARVDKVSQAETQIDATLAFAKQVAKDAKAVAEQQAQAILAKARLEAEDMLRRARRQVAEYAARALQAARQEAEFRSRLAALVDEYKELLEKGRAEAQAFVRVIAELSDEAAAASEAEDKEGDGGYDVDLGPDLSVDEPSGDEAGWGRETDEVDLEPTRRMEALRPRRPEA